MTLTLAPLVSLLAGILILVVPRLLSYIVAIYLIVIGLLGLFGAGSFYLKWLHVGTVIGSDTSRVRRSTSAFTARA
jgi:Protein of unknown function (DUF3096)